MCLERAVDPQRDGLLGAQTQIAELANEYGYASIVELQVLARSAGISTSLPNGLDLRPPLGDYAKKNHMDGEAVRKAIDSLRTDAYKSGLEGLIQLAPYDVLVKAAAEFDKLKSIKLKKKPPRDNTAWRQSIKKRASQDEETFRKVMREAYKNHNGKESPKGMADSSHQRKTASEDEHHLEENRPQKPTPSLKRPRARRIVEDSDSEAGKSQEVGQAREVEVKDTEGGLPPAKRHKNSAASDKKDLVGVVEDCCKILEGIDQASQPSFNRADLMSILLPANKDINSQESADTFLTFSEPIMTALMRGAEAGSKKFVVDHEVTRDWLSNDCKRLVNFVPPQQADRSPEWPFQYTKAKCKVLLFFIQSNGYWSVVEVDLRADTTKKTSRYGSITIYNTHSDSIDDTVKNSIWTLLQLASNHSTSAISSEHLWPLQQIVEKPCCSALSINDSGPLAISIMVHRMNDKMPPGTIKKDERLRSFAQSCRQACAGNLLAQLKNLAEVPAKKGRVKNVPKKPAALLPGDYLTVSKVGYFEG